MAELFKNKIVEHSKESGDIYSWIYFYSFKSCKFENRWV